MENVLEFHAEVPQATASEGFAYGPYVAARVGFEFTTLRMKGDESTNEPPHPTRNWRWMKWLHKCTLGHIRSLN